MFSGALSRVYAAMDAFIRAPDIQTAGCCTLSILSRGSIEKAHRIASTGGLTRLFSAMKDHPRDAAVQTSACVALQSITTREYDTVPATSSWDADLLVWIISSGGLGHIYASMEAHISSDSVQLTALLTLRNLCKHLPNLPTLRGGRAAALARKAMSNHATNGQLMSVGRELLDRLK